MRQALRHAQRSRKPASQEDMCGRDEVLIDRPVCWTARNSGPKSLPDAGMWSPCLSHICRGLLPMLYRIDRNPDWKVFLNISPDRGPGKLLASHPCQNPDVLASQARIYLRFRSVGSQGCETVLGLWEMAARLVYDCEQHLGFVQRSRPTRTHSGTFASLWTLCAPKFTVFEAPAELFHGMVHCICPTPCS